MVTRLINISQVKCLLAGSSGETIIIKIITQLHNLGTTNCDPKLRICDNACGDALTRIFYGRTDRQVHVHELNDIQTSGYCIS